MRVGFLNGWDRTRQAGWRHAMAACLACLLALNIAWVAQAQEQNQAQNEAAQDTRPADETAAPDAAPQDGEAEGAAPDTASAASGGQVWLISIKDAIGPASARYIITNLEAAQDAPGLDAVVLQMDTPGGLDTSMRDIIQAVLNSDVPVIGYVGPSGARAASAGLYILYASHYAAMAPGTNTGAATPVQLGGTPGTPGGEPPQTDDNPLDPGGGTDEAADGAAQDEAASNEQALRNKVVNDAVAYIRSLAELRGRNADWAEEAVRDGVSVSAEEALKLGVIEAVAPTVTGLLEQADGAIVTLEDGTEVTLAVAGAQIEAQEMTWTQEVFGIVSNPNIAFLLLNLGFIGLLAAFYTGEPIAGVLGAICLIVGFSALAVLPLNYAGVGLVLLGLVLLVMEAFITSYGLLSVAGLASFVLGGIYLIDSDIPALRIDLRVLFGIAAALGLSVFLILTYGLAMQTRKVVTGGEHLIGMKGKVLNWTGEGGYVLMDGERWRAASNAPLTPGQEVEATSLDGLIVQVKPA